MSLILISIGVQKKQAYMEEKKNFLPIQSTKPGIQFLWMQVVTTHSVLSRAIPPGPITVSVRDIHTEILGPGAAPASLTHIVTALRRTRIIPE